MVIHGRQPEYLREDVPEECNVLEFEYQTTLGMSNLELFFMDVKNRN